MSELCLPSNPSLTSHEPSVPLAPELLQRELLHTTLGLTGSTFFTTVAQRLSALLVARHVFICELVPGESHRARTLVAWMDGCLNESFEYDLEGTPCAVSVEQNLCYFPSGVQEAFPEDRDLVALNATSYFGVRLVGQGGRTVGVLAALGDQPIVWSEDYRSIMDMVAVRAGAEIERTQFERERELHREELGRYQRLMERTSQLARVGGWEFDIPSGAMHLSDEAYRIHDLEPCDLQPTSNVLLSCYSRETAAHIRQTIRWAVARGTGFALTLHLSTFKGRRATVRVTGAAEYQDGAPIRLVGAIQDITELGTLEAKYRHAQKMECIGQLAGGIAHDFNNLLLGIQGYQELASMVIPEEHPAQADLVEIGNTVSRARRLTKKLLSVARETLAAPTVVHLPELLHDTTGLLRRVLGRNIRLDLQLAEGLWPVYLDAGLLEQAVLNLAVNARDAMPEAGEFLISAHNVELRERGDSVVPAGQYVRITASDTGCGMPPEVAARVFEPFFTTKEPGKGTGLGLATTHGVVTQAGGHISVRSVIGRGTTFTILLPRCMAEERSPTPLVDRGLRGGTETIVIIEERHSARELAARVLELKGYTVLPASDPTEAILHLSLHEGRIDLLVCDRPQSGIEASLASLGRPAPRVLLTPHRSLPDSQAQAPANAGHALLFRPYTAQALLAAVREVLDAA